MKALVLEKRGDIAAVLREDGIYATTTQPGDGGETIELNSDVIQLPKRRKRWMRTAVAAVLALVLFTGSYSYLSVSASAYVSLDVGETSVEVSVNHLGRVISVSPLNEDSVEMARTLNDDMRGRKFEDAIPEAMGRFNDDVIAKEDDTFIIAGVTAPSDRRGEEITEILERAARENIAEDAEIYTFDVSRSERREAGDMFMSGGRFAFEQNGSLRPDRPAQPTDSPENRPSIPDQNASPDASRENEYAEDAFAQNKAPENLPQSGGAAQPPRDQVPYVSVGDYGGGYDEPEGPPADASAEQMPDELSSDMADDYPPDEAAWIGGGARPDDRLAEPVPQPEENYQNEIPDSSSGELKPPEDGWHKSPPPGENDSQPPDFDMPENGSPRFEGSDMEEHGEPGAMEQPDNGASPPSR